MNITIKGTLTHANSVFLTKEEVKNRILEQMKDKCFTMNAKDIVFKVTVWLKDIEVEVSNDICATTFENHPRQPN